MVGSNYINPEDNYGRLTDFLIQISKLFYFNVHDLADFIMHHHKVSRFVFVLIQSHTCACTKSFISRFVINWQFRRIDHIGSHKPVSVLSL